MNQELLAYLSRIRKYEIRIRKAVSTNMEGSLSSIFKGSGLEFSDVREYNYGDDVRTIDWNVTAKGHGVFVKTFKEEKEQTVFFMLDVSASQFIGLGSQKKNELAQEVCSVLALSAIKEGSQVGLYCFSDRNERYIKPGKGLRYAYEVITTIHNLKPSGEKTDLNRALFFALNILKKRSVVILVSDFIGKGYEFALKALARRHDLVLVQVYDKMEERFPAAGIIPIVDREQGRTLWVNTASPNFRKTVKTEWSANRELLEDFAKKNSANLVSLETGMDYVPTLIRLFKVRNKSKRIS